MSAIGWEVHDEGDTIHPNAATSSFSGVVKFSWISVDEAANMLGNEADDFIPERFDEIYEEVWTSHAPHAATLK